MLPEVIPVTELKRKATDIIKNMGQSKSRLLITQNGKAVAIMMDVPSYRELERKLEVLEAIVAGQKDLRAGRVVEHTEAIKRLSRFGEDIQQG